MTCSSKIGDDDRKPPSLSCIPKQSVHCAIERAVKFSSRSMDVLWQAGLIRRSASAMMVRILSSRKHDAVLVANIYGLNSSSGSVDPRCELIRGRREPQWRHVQALRKLMSNLRPCTIYLIRESIVGVTRYCV